LSKRPSTKHADEIPRNALKSGFFPVSEFFATLNIALPLGASYAGERLIGITDTIILGRLSPEALSASGLALSVYNIILLAGIGMLFPMIVLAAHARGANRLRTVPLLIRQGLWICGILAASGGAILWHVTPLLILTGQDPGIAGLAGDYMRFYLWTLFPALTTFGFTMAFAAMGRARTAATIVWLEVVINAILDYLLVFGKFGFPALGMAGAGLAGIIAYGTGHMLFFGLLAFHRFFRNTTKYLHAWRPRWHILRRFLYLGTPKSFDLLMRTGLYSGFSLLSGWVGIQALVMYTMVFETVQVINQLVGAVGSAGAAHTGMAYAGKNHTAIRNALGGTILILLMFLAPVIMVFLVFPEWVVMLFLGFGSPEAEALMPFISPVMVCAAFFVLAEGLRAVMVQALNGMSDMKVPALISVFVYWSIAFPLGILLGFVAGFDVLGFWMGLTFGMTIIAIANMVRFQRLVSPRRAGKHSNV